MGDAQATTNGTKGTNRTSRADGTTRPTSTGGTTVDVAVVGGGIAGLTAGAFAARSGASVIVIDARSQLGGRGRTTVEEGFHLNQGPHALYRAGAGAAALRELGIRPVGKQPPLLNPRGSLDGRLVRTTPPRAAAQVGRLLARLRKDRRDPAWVEASANEWIETRVSDPVGRHLAAALVRVSTYASDLDVFSADAAIAQLSAALKGVTYLDHGWSQLVGALDDATTAAGGRIRRDCRAERISADGDRWVVDVGDGAHVVASSVVIAAGGPAHAARLTHGASPSLADAADAAAPVHAACLDLGLARLPVPRRRFVLGLDTATYASVHTASARLADSDGQVLHVMRYEPDADAGPDETVADLEALADQIQPGWRDHERIRQVGQRRVVAFDRPRPGTGLAGRPGAVVPDLGGVFVAGDWVGPDDLIGGASLASGRAAGLAAAEAALGSRRPSAPPVVAPRVTA